MIRTVPRDTLSHAPQTVARVEIVDQRGKIAHAEIMPVRAQRDDDA